MPIYLNGKVLYEGAVLDDREENGYHDSDFYAVVWDEAEKKCKRLEYNTTRFAGGGSCRVDATEEVKEKARLWMEGWYVAVLTDKAERESKVVERGKRVRVVRGRKVAIGTEGEVFLTQEQVFSPRFRNGYKQGPDSIKIGLALSDRKEKNYGVEIANDEVIYSTPYGSEFVSAVKSEGGKWQAENKTWIVPPNADHEKLLEICERCFQKHADVAWTYARNVEVIDPEQYVDKESIRETAKRMAGQDCFYAPFVRMGCVI